MLCRVLLTAIAISYLICVLFLSGIQKEDLDLTLLRKLERRNVNLDDLNNEKVRQECFIKYYVDHGELSKNTTETTVNFDLASKENITKASFADLLDTSELEILLQNLKKNKNEAVKFTPDHTGVISVNRTKPINNNINVELKSIRYKIEIVTKRPVVTSKVNIENDVRGMPTLSNVIKFWNMYMKSNRKSNDEYNNDVTITEKVTTDIHHTITSEEADSISKVLEKIVSNKDTNSDPISERQLRKENKRFSNYQLNNGPHTTDSNKMINENDVPNQGNINERNKNILKEPFRVETLNDLSFKSLLKNIYSLFSNQQMVNKNKLSRIDINTKYESKPNKLENEYEQTPPTEADYPKHNEDKNGINNNPLLNNKHGILKSLLTNFHMNNFKDNGDIVATITRLEQIGDGACPLPLTTSPLKGNLSGDQKVRLSQFSGFLYDIMHGPTTAATVENSNYFEKNTEQYQKLIHEYSAPSEKNMNYFEQNTEHYEKLIQLYNVAPAKSFIYFERNTEQPQKLIQQYDTQQTKDVNYLQQNTEQYQKLIQQYNVLPTQNINYFEQNTEQYVTLIQKYNPPPVKTINNYEHIIEQPQKFIHQYKLPQIFELTRNQTFANELANSDYINTQSSTPHTPQLNEIVYTTPTPSILTAINNEKLLHPDVIKQIAENVKQLVLNDIQDRISAITNPVIKTELTTRKSISTINTSSIVVSTNNPITPSAIDTTSITLRPKLQTLENSPNEEVVISTTADMFAASLSKIDSEKLKQATIIIEKFIELFKHIKLMQEIKSMAMPIMPDTPRNKTLEEIQMKPQINLPVVIHPSVYNPPNPFDMKLKESSRFGLTQPQNPIDLMLQARKSNLDLQLQSIKPQHMFDINASQIPINFDPRLHPLFPFDMKFKPSKILPIIIDPYSQALQPLPFHKLNMNQPQVIHDIPNISKLNKSITVHQTDVGAIVPIKMVNPIGLNNNIVLSSPVPFGLTQDEKNRWNLMIKYGKSQAEIDDVQSRKNTLSAYSNTPNHTKNSNHELGSTQHSLSEFKKEENNNNVPLFKQDKKQYIDDFRIEFNPEAPSTATKQESTPQLKNYVNISNSETPKKANSKNSNFQDILAEVEKIAKVFGFNNGMVDKTKFSNKAENKNDQNRNREKIVKVFTYKNEKEDKSKSLNRTEDINDLNKNSSINLTFQNIGNAFETRLNNKEKPSIGIDYHSKLKPLDYRSKLDPRILHLNQMARILRANDKDEVFSNVFKRVYTPQKLKSLYTRRTPGNNHEYQVNPNYANNIMIAMDSFKNKEYREKGISYDRRYNTDGANLGQIPVGYHEKLERFEERSQYKDKDWRNGTPPQARPLAPISNIKPLSKYNDAPFKNFLKTQQKVNKILERILATRTDDAARSTETI